MTLSRISSSLVCLLLCGTVVHSGELTEKEFHSLLNEIQAKADAPWRQIPWKISLLESQKAAADQKKPIFIWAMDGHPLGCT